MPVIVYLLFFFHSEFKVFMLEIHITIRMIAKSEKYLHFNRLETIRRIDRFIYGTIFYRCFNDDTFIDDLCLYWSQCFGCFMFQPLFRRKLKTQFDREIFSLSTSINCIFGPLNFFRGRHT